MRTALIDELDTDSSSDKIWEHSDAKGQSFYVQFTYHLFNYNGVPARLAVAHDVTELVEKNEKNKSEFPQVRTEVTNSPLAVIEWNEDLTVKQWSEKAQDLFGWSEDEVVGNPDFFENFVHEDELEEAKERFKGLRKSDRSGFTIEGKNYTKYGDLIYCEWYNSVLLDKNGDLVSIYAQVHDINERKQSENLFKALSEEALVGVYLIQDGIFKYINPQFADIFGYEEHEIQNKLGPLDLTHPDDRDKVEENIQKRIEGKKKAIEYDFRCLTKKGETIHVNVYGSGITYQGKPAVVGTLVDITDSRLAYQRYRASVESFKDLFDSISDAIYIQDKSGKFLEVNKGAEKMYGYDREEFIGRTPDFLAAPGKVDMESTIAQVKKALEGEPQTFKFWGKGKMGKSFLKR
ncbi:MAG: PAS domain S-box protein [Balneolaceae bacterium]|nr:PAS domain S-box protein [Balneolaceae bacterium]